MGYLPRVSVLRVEHPSEQQGTTMATAALEGIAAQGGIVELEAYHNTAMVVVAKIEVSFALAQATTQVSSVVAVAQAAAWVGTVVALAETVVAQAITGAWVSTVAVAEVWVTVSGQASAMLMVTYGFTLGRFGTSK